MAQFQNMIITRAGLDMIAQSQAGGTLIFTKGKLGDGQIGDQSIPDLTDLINAKMSVELSSVTAKTAGHVEVRFIVDNTDLDVGFFVREVGIFAKVNDEGVEKLYGYANAGNYTNYLADKTVPIDSIITKIDLVVGNASNVAFTTDKSIVYVTLEDLEEAIDTHNKDSNAHEPAFDAHNAADDAHKDFTGATAKAAGKRGMVPAPVAGDQNKALFGDATYKQVVQKVNGVAPDSGGNVNVDMSDYLPLTGGTLTGTFTIRKTIADYGQINIISNNNKERRLDASDTYLRIAVMADEDTSVGGRYLSINTDNALERTLYLQNNISGEWSTYYLFGQHNIVTQEQAEVGTNNLYPMTPLRTAQAINALALPKGTILPFAGGTIPSGFLACNGAAVSRTTYAALFSAIGTAFGEGNGSTTFNLPNVEDNRFLEFSTTRGSQRNAGLPDITGSMTLRQTDTGSGASGRGAIGSVSGAFSMTTDVDADDFSYLNITTKSQTADLVTLDATKSSSIYGNSTTVQPKSLTVRAIIKY